MAILITWLLEIVHMSGFLPGVKGLGERFPFWFKESEWEDPITNGWKKLVFKGCLLIRRLWWSRAIFNQVILICFGFYFNLALTGLKSLCHPFNKSWLENLFSCTYYNFFFYVDCRLLWYFPVFWLAVMISLDWVLQKGIQKRFIS